MSFTKESIPTLPQETPPAETPLAHEKDQEKEKELILDGSDEKPMLHSRLAELEQPARHVYNHATKM